MRPRRAPTLPEWLNRRQSRRDLLLGGAGGFVAAMAWAQYQRHRGGLEILPRVRGRVVGVESGPRLRVKIDGLREPIAVGLLGVKFDGVKREAAGRWLSDTVAGRSVIIGFDRNADRRGGDGALLGYVYVGGEVLNEQAIARGLGRPDDTNVYELREWFERVAWRASRRKPPR